MTDQKQLNRTELLRNMEILQHENQMLSARAQEIFLLDQIGTILSEFQNEQEAMPYILERISVFLNIPYCAYVIGQEDGITIQHGFISTSNEGSERDTISITPELLDSIKAHPRCIPQNQFAEEGLSMGLQHHNFMPENIGLFHGSQVDDPSTLFVFADDLPDSTRLSEMTQSLENIIDKIVSQIDKHILSRKLKILNAELESRVHTSTEAFHESKDHFKMVMEQSPNVIEIYDLNGLQVEVNSAYEKLWGFSADTTLNQFNLFTSDEVLKSGLLEYVRRAYAGESVTIPDHFFDSSGATEAHGKGRQRWLSTRIYPLKNTQGQVEKIVITHEDITNKKKSEADLLAQESLYRGLFEASMDGICIVDQQGKFVDSNQSFQTLTGYSAEELTALRIKDIVHPEDQQKSAVYIEKLIKEGHYTGYEGRLITKSGKVCHIEVSSRAIFKDGDFHGSHDVIRDITSRKKSEELLKKSEERFKIIFHDAPDAYYLSNLKGVFVDGNKASEEILGYKKEQLVGKNFLKLNLLRVRDIPRAAKLLAQNVMGNPTGPDEFNLKRQDGSNVDVEIVTHSVRINGKALILGIARDISRRKKTENKIKESESNLKAIIENSLESIWSIDTNYIIQYTNEQFSTSFYDSFGIKISQGTNLLKTIPKSLVGKWKERYDRAFNNEAFVFEDAFVAGKARIYVEVAVTPILVDDKVIGASFYGRDITERKLAENELRESERKTQALLENSPACTKIVDLDFNLQFMSEQGIKDLNIEDINAHYGQPYPLSFYPESFRTPMQDNLKTVMETGEVITLEAPLVDTQGNEIWYHSTIVPVKDQHNKLDYIMIVSLDTTNRKQAELERQEALEKAQKANEVKDQFIANISHEIRTPLNSILGFSDLFKLRYSDLLQEKDKEIFDYIGESSERLMHTVDSILNISMLHTGTISVHEEKINLGQLVSIIVHNFKLAAKKKNLSINFNNNISPVYIHVDKSCISSAIANLTDNAIKYTKEGSVTLTLGIYEGQAKLSISDTGIGISEDYRERIYQPYTQESEGFTKQFQGVGLGLALTKRYLDLSDVELDLESEKNVGTTFTLTFLEYEGE